MRVFTGTDHEGHWVGVASVVVAPAPECARTLLIAELVSYGIKQSEPFTLKEIDLSAAAAIVLQNGDY